MSGSTSFPCLMLEGEYDASLFKAVLKDIVCRKLSYAELTGRLTERPTREDGAERGVLPRMFLKLVLAPLCQ